MNLTGNRKKMLKEYIKYISNTPQLKGICSDRNEEH